MAEDGDGSGPGVGVLAQPAHERHRLLHGGGVENDQAGGHGARGLEPGLGVAGERALDAAPPEDGAAELGGEVGRRDDQDRRHAMSMSRRDGELYGTSR